MPMSIVRISLGRVSPVRHHIEGTVCVACRYRRESRSVPHVSNTRPTPRLMLFVHLCTKGFYFSVQSGGSFDIDYTVQSPSEKVILEGTGERQGDYIFTANTVSNRYRIRTDCQGC